MEAKDRQEEELQNAIKDHFGNTDESTPEPEETEVESAEDVSIEEEVTPAPEQEEPTDLQREVADLKKKLSDAEHRFSVLQGKYNAEVPRLHQQLVEAQKPKVEETPEKPEDLDLGMLAEDYEEVNVLRKHYDTQISALKGEIQSLKSQLKDVDGKQARTNQEQYYTALSEAVPDWEEVGKSEEFKAWCREVDPISGFPRQVLLDDANEKMDSHRVINILNVFKGVASVPAKNESHLKRQVVPEKKRAVSAPENDRKPTYTRDQYEKGLDDLQRAMQMGQIRKEAFDKRIKEYHSAYMEGRVQ